MYADMMFRLMFFALHRKPTKADIRWTLGHSKYGFIWESYIIAVGYDPPEPEWHAMLIGPEWIGNIEVC